MIKGGAMKFSIVAVLAVVLLLAGACSESRDPIGHEGPLELTLEFVPEALAPNGPVAAILAATNISDSPVLLGDEPEGCWFATSVAYDGDEYELRRRCRDDDVRRWLDPGETATYSWDWRGVVVNDAGDEFELPPGTYDVRPVAAGIVGEPATIRIRELLPPEEQIEISVTLDPPVLTLGETSRVMVTTRNITDTRVLIGYGANAYPAVVQAEGKNLAIARSGLIVMDTSPRYLDPGEVATTSWDWDGIVRDLPNHESYVLRPGSYPIRGRTTLFEGDAMDFEVAASDLQLDVRVAVSPQTFAAGESVFLWVCAANQLEVPVKGVRIGDATFEVTFQAQDGSRFRVRAPYDFGLDDGIFVMEPGPAAESGWNWSGQALGNSGQVDIPPGTYAATGCFGNHTSEPIEVEIAE